MTMPTNKKPRKKYRSRPTVNDPISYALAGVTTMRADKGALLAKQVLNSGALAALCQGVATKADMDALVHMHNAVEAPSEAVPPPVTALVTPAATPEAGQPGAIKERGDDRYQRIRAGVLAGSIRPSVRAIRDAGGGGTETVRRYLQQLAAEGAIVKEGQGYALATKPPGGDLFI